MATEKYWKMPDHFAGNTADIAVVGAGIIGVACALQLARQGQRARWNREQRRVELVDR